MEVVKEMSSDWFYEDLGQNSCTASSGPKHFGQKVAKIIGGGRGGSPSMVCTFLVAEVYELGISIGFPLVRKVGILSGEFYWVEMRSLWLSDNNAIGWYGWYREKWVFTPWRESRMDTIRGTIERNGIPYVRRDYGDIYTRF